MLEAVHATSAQSPVTGFPSVARWDPFLKCHPDQEFAAFLRRGFTFGFRIGFDRRRCSGSNLRSVLSCFHEVDRYLAEEVAAGKLRPASASCRVHTSPILG